MRRVFKLNTVSIHQPNYFPYYGYFNKIKNSDIFVFLDNVTFSKDSFINRNKIKTPEGIKWLTVPVKNKDILSTEIKDVEIFGSGWKDRHIKIIENSYRKTPNFWKIYDILIDVYSRDWKKMSDLNIYIIKSISKEINLKTEFVSASNLGVSGKSTELILNICKKLKADIYLSGSSGKNYMEEKRFLDNNIVLKYQEFSHPIYKQFYGDFVKNLSILDILFNTEVDLC